MSLGGDVYAPTVTGSGVSAAVMLANVVDYTPRMISLTVTTAGATPLRDDTAGHIVTWNSALYAAASPEGQAYRDVIDGAGIDIDTGGRRDHRFGLWSARNAGPYRLSKDPRRWLARSRPDRQWRIFHRRTNPGVAPVNGWFALFGQFFDHGLDFVGKGADGTKITINLSPDDPMYGVIDPTTGQPATKIVIIRARRVAASPPTARRSGSTTPHPTSTRARPTARTRR